ncbi:hypothetical protein OC842_004106 [Tilletia horrida]|uniref:DNA-directed RNA polymerase subunit beta n=1 Tax=Tilletia horrida TaxID=155126 RepID=A0AAN6GA71_9BASI|nr:hypothetical protein OC842_004106 [Tilletia horrida]
MSSKQNGKRRMSGDSMSTGSGSDSDTSGSSSSGSGSGSGSNGHALSTSPASSLSASASTSAARIAKGSADDTFLNAYDAAVGGGSAGQLPKWAAPHTFHQVETQKMFTAPSTQGLDIADLQELTAPHIESFNALWEQDPSVDTPQSIKRSSAAGLPGDGLLARALQRLSPKVVFDGAGTAADGSEDAGEGLGNRLELRIASVTLSRPFVAEKAKDVHERRIFPAECRERLTTYKARMTAQIDWSVNGQPAKSETVNLGHVPVMVKSNRCNIRGMTSRQLADRMEETTEMGGYFIINGNERLIRFLIVNRANHVIAIDRPSFQNRGPSYSTKGCMIRCLHRDDLTSVTNTVHYLENGGITLRFSWRKQEYMIPIIMVLKALTDATDKDIFSALMQGDFENTFLSDRVELLLRSFKSYALWTGHQCLEYLGSKFRVVMAAPDDASNREIGAMLIQRLVLVHLDQPRDKFNLLIFMMRKLYALVRGECCVDNPDSPQHQEILMPGFLYGSIIKERVDEYLAGVRAQIARDVRTKAKGVDFFDGKYITKSLSKVNSDIGARLNNFLATGNLTSTTGLDLQQASGFTIVAEKLNFYRYVSHFRCVHRGAFFAELKTTAVRKLLPESWGFLCPVHTPDGSPCGLLNHFSHSCRLITRELNTSSVRPLLIALGMSEPFATDIDAKTHVAVQLDGVIIGYATPTLAQKMAIALRIWKTENEMNGVPLDLEIGFVPRSKGGQYPGLYLFSSRARMMRPVRFLHNNKTDSVGPFEQVYLDIACWPEEIEAGVSTHVELSPTNVLSVIANLTPFSDFNQSPRLMYQCLTVDHEVLTRTGWKALAQVQRGEEVMTMNLVENVQEWNAVDATVKIEHNGPLYRLHSADVDAVCDASHRWYLTGSGQAGSWAAHSVKEILDGKLSEDGAEQWESSTGSSLHRTHSLPILAKNTLETFQWPDMPWLSDIVDEDDALNIDWCKFVGMAIVDGELDDGAIKLSQRTDNPECVASTAAILQKLSAVSLEFGEVKLTLSPTIAHWSIHSEQVCSFFQPLMRCKASADATSAPRKQRLNPSWLTELSAKQARALLEGVAVATADRNALFEEEKLDGVRSRALSAVSVGTDESSDNKVAGDVQPQSVKRDEVQVLTDCIPLANDLHMLGLRAGARVEATVNQKQNAPQSRRLQLTFAFGEEQRLVPAPRPELYENPQHDGFVYCVKVANDNFLARRKPLFSEVEDQSMVNAGMKAFFTGNCQMGKQTMGTPSTALNHRTDNKLYRIQNPQTPVVRPKLHSKYGFDHFPNGTNAIVAVISYTGYDMEDAMILNKSAHERGFGYGTVYKSETVDLKDIIGETTARTGPPTLHFGIGNDIRRDHPVRTQLDVDGLPFVGSKMYAGQILCAYFDEVRGKTTLKKYKGDEVGYIDVVRLIGTDSGDSELQKVQFTIRIPRAPVIGDKFSSRHGQKGVCSQKWPAVDMPFSESGMQPDVIINPHAFPSRMTIGMLIESMAGKAGAMHGLAQDATPWTFSEDDTPVDFFGEQLKAAGYNYVGNEPMYSGITGEEFAADIYLGVVYYQRLRHMVNDKFQVRTTGPVHQLTRQPIKGRKRAGGIRFGEMERDALIAHGTSFLLQDRLMNCSDYSTAWICRTCGSLISLGFDEYAKNGISVLEASASAGQGQGRLPLGGGGRGSNRHVEPVQNGPSGEYCRVCRAAADAKALRELDGEFAEAGAGADADMDGLVDTGHQMKISRESVIRSMPGGLDVIAVPYVLRYLTAELAAMGLKLSFKIE